MVFKGTYSLFPALSLYTRIVPYLEAKLSPDFGRACSLMLDCVIASFQYIFPCPSTNSIPNPPPAKHHTSRCRHIYTRMHGKLFSACSCIRSAWAASSSPNSKSTRKAAQKLSLSFCHLVLQLVSPSRRLPIVQQWDDSVANFHLKRRGSTTKRFSTTTTYPKQNPPPPILDYCARYLHSSFL